MTTTRMARLGISFPYMAAPMVGISHAATRALIREYTPADVRPLCFTEMLSTRKIPSESLASTEELRTVPGETHFIPQLLGNEERFIEPSLKKLLTLNPWGIDINMGCPQTHVLRHNWGVRLMGDTQYAADVVRVTKRHAHGRPVSVKLRGGADADVDESYLVGFAQRMGEAGCDWLTVHPRPRKAKHSGPANWGVVARVRREIDIPVVANGDIQTVDDALHIVNDLGCDGAMIARAITVRPWIFWQLAERLGLSIDAGFRGGVRAPHGPQEEGEEYARAVCRLIELLQEFFGDTPFALQKLRFFVATGSRWFLFGHSYWKLTMKAKSLAEAHESFALLRPGSMESRIEH